MADSKADEQQVSHTPGPWSVSFDPWDKEITINGPEAWVAYDDVDHRIQEANARLIAAAPDLLDALKELVAVVRGECPSLLNEDSGGSARLDMAIDDAIAKAEGRDRE